MRDFSAAEAGRPASPIWHRRGTKDSASRSLFMTNSIKSQDGLSPGAGHAPVHDMDQALPVDSLKNLARKSQQLKARAVAGRHIDEALSDLAISDGTKSSRKAKLIDMPAGTPDKRRRRPST